MGCLEWVDLEQYARDELSEDMRASFDLHLSDCSDCRETLSDVFSNLGVVDDLKRVFSHGLCFMPGPAAPMPGAIGEYRIIRELGRGGMGVVFEAEQPNPRREVALKVVHRRLHIDHHHIRLFQREIQALARLKHPYIAAIYQAGQSADQQPYFVMELVRGLPLNEHVHGQGLSRRQRCVLFGKICDAINYAHQRGVIHRDLKSSNVLVDSEGQPKVLDFGLAKLTEAEMTPETMEAEVGKIKGTLAYMSPEQTRGRPDEIDVRTDVYALGVIFYEMLTGRLPYDVNSVGIFDAIEVIRRQAPRRPGAIDRALRGDLETILLKALEKDPQRRYPSVASLREDVERYLANLPIQARPPSMAYLLRKLVKRHTLPFALAMLVFLLVTGFGVWMSVLYARSAANLVRAHKAENDAHNEAETAKRVRDFLVQIFDVADPSEGRGNTITAREILDQGSANILMELENQPEIQSTLMDTMGTVYTSLGLYDQAIPLLERALDIRRRLYGAENAHVAETLNNLGMAFKKKDDYAAAEPLYEQALAMRRRLLGDESLEVAESLNNLGALRLQQNRFDEAFALVRQAVELRRKIAEGDDRQSAIGLSNLATMLMIRGDYAGAKEYARQALDIRRRVLSEGHREIAISLDQLGHFLHVEGKHAEAEPLFRESLAIRKRLLGDRHPDVADSLNDVASTLQLRGQYAAAEPLLREALDIKREAFGPLNADVLFAMTNLADVLLRKGDHPAAQLVLRDLLDALERRQPHDPRRIANVLLHLGLSLMATDDPEQAEWLLREGLELRRWELPEGNWQIASAESALGRCLVQLGRYEEAAPLLLESYPILAEAKGEGDPQTQEAFDALTHIWDAWDSPDDAVFRQPSHP